VTGLSGRRPTMRDVAEAAGVSRALVSIVFRGAPGASEQTRARVLEVADRLGFSPNRSASLLKLRRNRHLGVTMSVRSPFHAELVEDIQAAADAAGYEVVLSAVTAGRPEDRAVSTLLDFRCEALLLLGTGLDQPALAALAHRVPLALVGGARAPRTLEFERVEEGPKSPGEVSASSAAHRGRTPGAVRRSGDRILPAPTRSDGGGSASRPVHVPPVG
jgi:DNA-binding LacI/PurR family transcriptional regulator